MSVGKVWLVGAGPSDVGLFTLKGKKVLEQAEVVVYDALVGHGVLSMIPKGVKLIDVGKRAGNHTLPQWRINEVLLEEAQAGKRVVRLKGGDPFMFGRGGEELELLSANNIPYEVVPGVTSPLSVPAYNGIPVTHRDYCSSLHIITGHKKKGETYDTDFEALVRTKGTLVFMMGVSALEDICNGLIRGGMDKDMPAAILQKGTSARQKRIVATVSTLKAEVDRQGIETPAIIVVGKVCALADEFYWYEKLPLYGCRVLVTRPRELASKMSDALREKGAEVVELPAIRTEPIMESAEINKALANLDSYQWIGFTSQIGVRVFFDILKERKMDIRSLAGCKFAVIGAATKKALEERGLFADFIPSVYDGETLGRELAPICNSGDKILLPRAKMGGKEIVEELKQIPDVQIDDVPIYDTLYEKSEVIDEAAQFANGNIDYAVFTSASTVHGFAKAVAGMDFTTVEAICIGRQTADAAASYGMKTHVADKARIEHVIDKTVEVFNKKKEGK
ncbi:Uroporphyrinogen-III methyltransferase / Uroporphyrinogen-III synthase [Lachnospiraceae bacterium TWA4]|nr:Uroporphyrinogen-III methyltransferase / Uroporphyrinogen-III synthase [Lachnospiraceae bacterium TWA4]